MKNSHPDPTGRRRRALRRRDRADRVITDASVYGSWLAWFKISLVIDAIVFLVTLPFRLLD